jgi:hypothetical protein
MAAPVDRDGDALVAHGLPRTKFGGSELDL